MHFPVSIPPSPTHPTDTMGSQDDTTKETAFPLSSVATPPSIKYTSFEAAYKACKLKDLTPRKRSVASDDGLPPLINTSFKRARLKEQAVYDQPTAFPSPSPTPVNASYHPTSSLLDPLPNHPNTHPAASSSRHLSPLDLTPSLPHSYPPVPSLQPLISQPDPSPHPSSSENKLWLALDQLPSLVDTYDTLAEDQKTYVLFQLLKRSSKTSLKFVNSIIMPALKRDFLASLPRELALHVISFLDAHSLCHAAMVSRTWRSIIEQDHSTWRLLLYKDGLMEPHEPDSVRSMLRLQQRKDEEEAPKIVEMDDPMEIDEQPDEVSAIVNPYKEEYRQRHMLRQNWRHGRFKRIRFRGHYTQPAQNVVTCLQFDDDHIISGMDDRMINIYHTKTGRHLRTLRGHEGGVWALQYIGNTLVSGSTDRTVRVWDIESGNCTHVFYGHTSTVRCLEIVMPKLINGQMQPAEPLIVTGSRDFTLRVWRLPDPTKDQPFYGSGVNPWYRHTLAGHVGSVRAITAHGNTLVSGSYDNTVGVWDLSTGRLVHRMEGHSQKVYTVVIDPDRGRCISGSMDGTVRIWDLATGQPLEILQGHTILVGLLGLTSDYLVSAAADSTLRVWHPEAGICRHVLSGHQAAITCFQHDNDKVISGSEGALKMWDIKTGRHITDLITNVDHVWRITFNKHRCVAAVCKDEVTSFEVLDFSVVE
ncbi:WD40 repeat-like protein [Hesseltinella vesiculosa]|uniref:WD40 repeat-like protein n=1 Tax=Hesseltinella vesiculosa TaxID=101127 RepID=A0A1X2GMR7_9FUNG|nr:WD40 repeat-like protein [Hesseltinella vesiculosa]